MVVMVPEGGKKSAALTDIILLPSVSKWPIVRSAMIGFGGWGDKVIAVSSARSLYINAAVIS